MNRRIMATSLVLIRERTDIATLGARTPFLAGGQRTRSPFCRKLGSELGRPFMIIIDGIDHAARAAQSGGQ
jgi:hypothetical protein